MPLFQADDGSSSQGTGGRLLALSFDAGRLSLFRVYQGDFE
jgi:hypothetical protein